MAITMIETGTKEKTIEIIEDKDKIIDIKEETEKIAEIIEEKEKEMITEITEEIDSNVEIVRKNISLVGQDNKITRIIDKIEKSSLRLTTRTLIFKKEDKSKEFD